MTVVLGASAVVLSTYVSDTFMYLCGFTLIMVTFVAPVILMWAQKYKKWVKMITSTPFTHTAQSSEIRGPWDVAVPIVI